MMPVNTEFMLAPGQDGSVAVGSLIIRLPETDELDRQTLDWLQRTWAHFKLQKLCAMGAPARRRYIGSINSRPGSPDELDSLLMEALRADGKVAYTNGAGGN